jgi:hypothetical protein
VASGSVGTRTQHFLAYISNILDCNDMKRLYLVIDNVLIHTPVRGRELVDNTGYKCCLYLPPYSPFLTTIPLSPQGAACPRKLHNGGQRPRLIGCPPCNHSACHPRRPCIEELAEPAGSRGRSSERELRITETHKKQERVGEI